MATYKLLHIADLHLDHPFGWLEEPELRVEWKLAQRKAFQSALERAKREGAQAILIAGDLVEGRRFSPDTVNFLRQAFEEVGPTPVYIAAGNHDPMLPDSPYLTAEWPPNVTFMPPSEVGCFEACDGLLICGRSHARELERANPLAGFEGADPGAVTVLLLHATYTEWSPSDFFGGRETFPVPRRALEASGVDYVALGHLHSCKRVEFGGGVGCYPGSPVAVVLSEVGPRHFLLVEVGKGEASITPIPTRTKVVEVEVDCTGAGNLSEILERAEAAVRGASKGNILVVRLTGRVSPKADVAPESVKAALKGDFDAVKVLDETVPAHDIKAISEEQSVRGEFVRLTLERIEAARKRGDAEGAALLEKALQYGLDAFEGRRPEEH